MLRRFFGRLIRSLLRLVPRQLMAKLVGGFAVYYARALSPAEGLRFLFGLDQRTYHAEGKLAIQYGGGVHTKHRHLRYHDFFVERVEAGQRVLDIGCGNGELAHDLADRAGAFVWGIDINERRIAAAKALHSHPNITYWVGDAFGDLPGDAHFDVIILSNVMEHLKERVALLRQMVRMYHPARILVRVPSYERDWRVPLQDELGIDYRLDPTHEIEFTQKALRAELEEAGLVVEDFHPIWGELWVSACVA